MRKLPPHFHRAALAAGTSFFMTFLVSGVSTWRVLGWDTAMIRNWMASWMVSWAIAAPTMYFMMPVVRRAIGRLIHEA
ncbi:MAG: DUF2798 domain-containing protein [Alphaproteobacteria bacterium]|nr:DUF2798 domain-containing protein [Alphaproteobacteria bacterium]